MQSAGFGEPEFLAVCGNVRDFCGTHHVAESVFERGSYTACSVETKLVPYFHAFFLFAFLQKCPERRGVFLAPLSAIPFDTSVIPPGKRS